jgi:hypothetical protein
MSSAWGKMQLTLESQHPVVIQAMMLGTDTLSPVLQHGFPTPKPGLPVPGLFWRSDKD